MEELEFRVSAKTAKLIGRENISAVDGAIIELVKNAYDADAECVYIKYNMPFPNILKNTTYTYLEHYLNKEELKYVLKFYDAESKESDKIIRKNEIKDEDIAKLQSILFSKNEIIIIDNGIGMTQNIMKTTWMNIATSDKEKNMYSEKGRIKTGAKGIGRFALEKLSTATKVYTKNKFDKLLEWNINWKQFDEVELLNDIKATLENKNGTYEQIVEELIGKTEFSRLKKFNWSTGTILVLTPTREEWTERLFKKVNTNMQSINPLGTVDTFEIYINNTYDSNFNFMSNNMEIQDYDYRIKAEYDGNNTIKVLLKRNEVDLNAEKAITKINGKIYEFNLSEFWNREAFKVKNYHKEDYDKEIEINLIVDKEIKDYELEKITKVGPFKMDLYFMKGGNSDDSIIKKIKKKSRTEMLEKFSGIKLYRDNFKVRPYGEFDDGMYDWLNLGVRAQKSPAGIKHPSGNWRTLPYQTIGCVEIGRNENPRLIDMANREGLATNEEYYIFVEMIQKVLSAFEYDRQYVYREYGKWLSEKEEKIDNKERILESIKNEKEKNNDEYSEENDEYSKKEYRETVYKLNKEKIEVIDRSEECSTDTATTESVMLDFSKRVDYTNLILIQCTNPMITTKDIDGAIAVHPKFDSVLSTVVQKRFYWKFNNDGSISEIEHDIKKRPRRQDWDGVLAENGSIYIISKENLLKGQCRLYGRIGTYIMPDSSYYEIDEDIDWIIIEKLLKNKK